MLKEELRKEIRCKKRHFTQQQLREMSLPVINNLLKNTQLQKAKIIVMYSSLPDEVFTSDVINELYQQGKTILLPVCVDNNCLKLRKYTGEESMVSGAFDILEPQGADFEDYETIDLIVVPGVAFDSQGRRLGRGKGYYDRFLSSVKNKYKIGICFDFQLVEKVPTDKKDIQMDEVITAKRILRQ